MKTIWMVDAYMSRQSQTNEIASASHRAGYHIDILIIGMEPQVWKYPCFES